MSITYSTTNAAHTPAALMETHGLAAERGEAGRRVLGYVTTQIVGDDVLEILYAVRPDGRTFASGQQSPSTSFGSARGWVPSDVPADACFIGIYHDPV